LASASAITFISPFSASLSTCLLIPPFSFPVFLTVYRVPVELLSNFATHLLDLIIICLPQRPTFDAVQNSSGLLNLFLPLFSSSPWGACEVGCFLQQKTKSSGILCSGLIYLLPQTSRVLSIVRGSVGLPKPPPQGYIHISPPRAPHVREISPPPLRCSPTTVPHLFVSPTLCSHLNRLFHVGLFS